MRKKIVSLIALIVFFFVPPLFAPIEDSEQDASSLRDTASVKDQTIERDTNLFFVKADGEVLEKRIETLELEIKKLQDTLTELGERTRRIQSLIEELLALKKSEPTFKTIGEAT